MLASYNDAQDLTQKTFLRAWAKRESFQGRASLRTWLYRNPRWRPVDDINFRPEG